jgi:hypothetical protein
MRAAFFASVAPLVLGLSAGNAGAISTDDPQVQLFYPRPIEAVVEEPAPVPEPDADERSALIGEIAQAVANELEGRAVSLVVIERRDSRAAALHRAFGNLYGGFARTYSGPKYPSDLGLYPFDFD